MMSLVVALRKFLLQDLSLTEVSAELRKLSEQDKIQLTNWFNNNKDVLVELGTDKVIYKEEK